MNPDSRGFTLLEVVVALAILSLAVVTSIQLFAGGLRLLKVSGEHQQAILLADQKTRELDTLAEGSEAGREGPFAWERSVRATTVPAELRVSGTRPSRIYSVTTQVRWGENRVVEISTYRTGHPREPGEPDEPDE